MHRAGLFIVLAACSSSPVVVGRASVRARDEAVPPIVIDAALAGTEARPTRGGACGTRARCTDDQTCLAMPGGYCASRCDRCDGTCVETRAVSPPGPYCLASCSRDDECRLDEGYLCDRAFHACVMPNSTPIVPAICPNSGPRPDPSFGAATIVSPGRSPSFVGDLLAIDLIESHGLSTETGLIIGRSLRVAGTAAKWRGVVRSETGIGFGDATGTIEVGAPDCGACDAPAIAIGKAGTYVAYAVQHGIRVRASADGGGSFRPAITAAPGDYGDLAATSDGRVHVVALDGTMHGAYGSAMHRIVYAVSRDGAKTFDKFTVVSGREESIPFVLANPMIAVDERRAMIYVVYARGDRSAIWDIVLASSKDKGLTWTRTAIGDGCSLHALPAIAVDSTTGVVHLAYYANGRFAHATCVSGTCTPRGTIGDSAFTTARYGTEWLGDRAALSITGRTLRAAWVSPIDGIATVMTASAKL